MTANAPDAPKADAAKTDAPEDDVRRKFREALQRKQDHHTASRSGADETDPSHVHGAHGPARTQRSFRRKSGG
jgi:hypothetical protein